MTNCNGSPVQSCWCNSDIAHNRLCSHKCCKPVTIVRYTHGYINMTVHATPHLFVRELFTSFRQAQRSKFLDVHCHRLHLFRQWRQRGLIQTGARNVLIGLKQMCGRLNIRPSKYSSKSHESFHWTAPAVLHVLHQEALSAPSACRSISGALTDLVTGMRQ